MDNEQVTSRGVLIALPSLVMGAAATGQMYVAVDVDVIIPSSVPEIYRRLAAVSVVGVANSPSSGHTKVTYTVTVPSQSPASEQPVLVLGGSKVYNLWAGAAGLTGSAITGAVTLPVA